MVSLMYWMMWLLIVTCVGFGIWGLVRHHGPLLIIGAVCGLAFATNTALGEPGFEASLRATARQRRGTTMVAPSETLAGRYPHRLVVPIRSACGEMGKYALFRATSSAFDVDDREDAAAVATLLAVALHQYRLARA